MPATTAAGSASDVGGEEDGPALVPPALRDQGYLLFRRAVDPCLAAAAIAGDRVDYGALLAFVRRHMLAGAVDARLPGWATDFVKLRVSDDDNADASAFHRDVIAQQPGACRRVPVYTCLTYLDATTLELIPGSHAAESCGGFWDALALLRRSVRLRLEPGDVLLFHAALLHRGIFTERLAHRRLVQVFECFPTRALLEAHRAAFVHVRGYEGHNRLVLGLSRVPGVVDALNLAGFLNAAMGYGTCAPALLGDPGGDAAVAFFSNEGFCGRLDDGAAADPPGRRWREINKYVLVRPTRDLPAEAYGEFKWACYNRQFAAYALVVAVLVAALVWGRRALLRRAFLKPAAARVLGVPPRFISS
jgi:hypothetical protein